MEDWKEYKLKDLVKINTGYPFKSKFYGSSGGTSVVRGENVSLGFLRWDTHKTWNDSLQGLQNYLLQEGDVLIGMDGSRVGRNRAQVKKNDLPLLLAQRVACLRAKKINELNQDYLYYNILSRHFQYYIDAVKTGTSIPHISATQIGNFEILLPPIEEQKSIANILSSLDDKIELNRKMNQTLEKMAKAIYKQWFEDFEFPNEEGKAYKTSGGAFDGELPKYWKHGKLSDLIKLTYGKALKSTDREIGEFPVMGSNGVVDFHKEYLVEGPGIVIGRKGSAGEVNWIDDNFFPIDTTFYIETIKESQKLYFYYFLVSGLRLDKMSSDSAVPGLNRNHAHDLKIIIPKEGLINNFNDNVQPLFEEMRFLRKEIKILIGIRDRLLPKLISGQLPINHE